MSKLNCNVVRDLLPLYADEVVSDDSRELVEEHLQECKGCRKMLFEMKKQVVIPVQEDSAGAMKKFKHRWNRRQVLKGSIITLALMALVIGGICYSYMFGLPVTSDLVQMKTGFQCVAEFDPDELDTPEKVAEAEASIDCPTAEQQWVIDISTELGRTRTRAEYEYTENAAGEQVVTGMTIYVSKAPFKMEGDNVPYIRNAFCIPEGIAITEATDFFVKVVCADETITFSMRDEGLFDPPGEHLGYFCPWVD